MSEQTEFEQKRQEFVRQVVNKIIDDPAFREKIIADPFGTMASGDLAQGYAEMNKGSGEVLGYSDDALVSDSQGCCGATCGNTY